MTSPTSHPFGDRPDPPPVYGMGTLSHDVVKAELVQPGRPDPGERISILYLMVWTAGSALILTFFRQTLDQPTAPNNPPWLQAITALLISPLQGAGVAALGLAIWRKLKLGRPFPVQPGHRLLVIGGIMAIVSWPLYLTVHSFFPHGLAFYLAFYRLPLLVLFCVITSIALSQMKGEERWQGMFLLWIGGNILGFLVVSSAVGGAMSFRWAAAEMYIVAAMNLAFLIPAILDVRTGCKRDQLHRFGVACRVANIGMFVISLIRMFLPTR